MYFYTDTHYSYVTRISSAQLNGCYVMLCAYQSWNTDKSRIDFVWIGYLEMDALVFPFNESRKDFREFGILCQFTPN